MKSKFKKYVPITLLIASLGLGFNTGCKSGSEKEGLEQAVEHVVGGKMYIFSDIKHREFANKGLDIKFKVEILGKEKSVKNLDAFYTCYTNIKGEFIIDLLELYPEEGYLLHVNGAKESEHSKLKVRWVAWNNHVFKRDEPTEGVSEEEKEKYIDFGSKQLNLYNKLLNIEEKKRNSQGKNIYYVLKDLDISRLSALDLYPEDDSLKARLENIEIEIDGEKFERVYLRDCSSFETMVIVDKDKDRKADRVGLDAGSTITPFGRKNNGYEYIKDLYTEEQVENIFADADQKLELVNEAIEGYKSIEKYNKLIEESKKEKEEIVFEELLEQFG